MIFCVTDIGLKNLLFSKRVSEGRHMYHLGNLGHAYALQTVFPKLSR